MTTVKKTFLLCSMRKKNAERRDCGTLQKIKKTNKHKSHRISIKKEVDDG